MNYQQDGDDDEVEMETRLLCVEQIHFACRRSCCEPNYSLQREQVILEVLAWETDFPRFRHTDVVLFSTPITNYYSLVANRPILRNY